MTVREEVREMTLNAGYLVLEESTGRKLSPGEKRLLERQLDARIPEYTGTYPVRYILDRMESLAGVAHINGNREFPGWEYPVTEQYRRAILESAENTRIKYFGMADDSFKAGDVQQATEQLNRAVTCSITAIGASLGWPHGDPENDVRVMAGIACGKFPAEGESIYRMLDSAPERGQDLNSAFAAATGQPEAVRTGAYLESGRTSEEATMFARMAVELADELGRELR